MSLPKSKVSESNNKQYGYLETKLNSKDLLYKEHDENPNLLAITHAVKYRENSEIPGLHKIKEFVLKYNLVFKMIKVKLKELLI